MSDAQRKVKEAITRAHRAAGMIRTAAGAPPFQKGDEAPEAGPSKGMSGMARNIPKGHPYDPKALKPLAKMLWAMSVAMGHALTAYRSFTKLKSSMISPDGMLGGRGYVMSVKEVRQSLYDACEALSAISDTIHDEINGAHWKPKLDDLGENDAEDIKKYLDEAEDNLDNPEADAEEEASKMEEENDGPDGTPNVPKGGERWGDDPEDDKESASKMPGGGAPEAHQGKAPFPREQINKQANSSVAPATLPGPRVEHIQPERGYGPYGSENKDEMPAGDPWGQNQGVGAKNPYVEDEPAPKRVDMTASLDPARMAIKKALRFEKALPDAAGNLIATARTNDELLFEYKASVNGEMDWHDMMVAKAQGGRIQAASVEELRATLEAALQEDSPLAQSVMPSDGTPTDANDFGLGYGAKGKGIDEGTAMPSGPSSGLPSNPGGAMHDVDRDAFPAKDTIQHFSPDALAQSELPNDGEDPVCRSDYYDGPMGNLGVGAPAGPGDSIAQGRLPGDEYSSPWGVGTPESADPMASSDLPGDGMAAPFNYDRNYPGNGGYQQNRGDIPFVERPSR